MNATRVDTVRAQVRYAARNRPPGIIYALAQEQSTCQFESHETDITNARPLASTLSLDTNGFILLKQSTSVTDFDDARQIDEIYVPEVQELIKRLTGAQHVIVFHKVSRREGAETGKKREPSFNLHADYTADTLRYWAKQQMGEAEATRRLRGRWMSLNVWRGISPVERTPLALADGRTIRVEDLVPVEIHEDIGQPTPLVGVQVQPHPAQRLYYFREMQTDEALVFTLYDSEAHRTQRVAHTAFIDPTSRPDAAPRESFEVRTLAFFE